MEINSIAIQIIVKGLGNKHDRYHPVQIIICDKWEITTVKGLGNELDGYSDNNKWDTTSAKFLETMG